MPTSLVALGLLYSFLHHLSFHIYLLSHKDMNTITATIFQLEVLGTNMLARSSTPRLFRLARLFRLLPIRMIATEVPRGRCSARSACVAGVARDLEQIGIYVEAQLAAGRQISQALAAQADAPAVGCIILQLGTCTRKSGDLTKQQQRQWQHR